MTVKPQAASRSGDRTVEMSPLTRWMRRNALQIGIVFVAILIWLVFVICCPRRFSVRPDLQLFHVHDAVFALMALPLTLVVIAKEIDLSFPSIMAWGMVRLLGRVRPHQQRLFGPGGLPGCRDSGRLAQRLDRGQGRHSVACGHPRHFVLLGRRGVWCRTTAAGVRWWRPKAARSTSPSLGASPSVMSRSPRSSFGRSSSPS